MSSTLVTAEIIHICDVPFDNQLNCRIADGTIIDITAKSGVFI